METPNRSDRFSGRCIGGPEDGKFLSCNSPILHVVDIPPFKAKGQILGNEVFAPIKRNVKTYKAVRFCADGTKGFIWVFEGLSVEAAFKEFLAKYGQLI